LDGIGLGAASNSIPPARSGDSISGSPRSEAEPSTALRVIFIDVSPPFSCPQFRWNRPAAQGLNMKPVQPEDETILGTRRNELETDRA
jgi:hypothetical protein